eukprot:NODE_2412_length_1124_cov_26.304186_g2004_i0.p2 GENE.NODE_2412_length_1124_cov_26.304186_g2004_i0~~NODE_2412_length_1124_cov_26.304186_g2004_i0.p2  ORF type:complete len:167 (+),score=23.01 NODE_2412_length_1124_cov_26.304186_g2004_i0:538-1038(+)
MIVHKHNLEESHHFGVAVDGSEASMTAVHVTSRLFRVDKGDRVTVYCAYNPPSATQFTMLSSGEPMMETNPHYEGELAIVRKKIDATLLSAKKALLENGVPEARINTFGEQVDDVKQAIVDFTDKNDIHTIICGTRGLGTLSRLLMGSVSTFVSTHARSATFLAVQ